MDILQNYNWVAIAEKAVIALAILLVTAIIAAIVKGGLRKLFTRAEFLRRNGSDGRALGDSIGTIGALLIWLFGLVAVLQVLSLQMVLLPIQGMLNTFMAFLPNVIGAGIVFFIGYVLARIARQLTVAALNAAGLDRRMARFTATRSGEPVGSEKKGNGSTAVAADGTVDTPSTGISAVIGNVVFAVILLVVAISALQILGIAAISVPAASMLQIILDAIPRIIAAGLLLALGVFIARFAGQLLEGVLRGFGVDQSVNSLGLSTRPVEVSSILAKVAQIAIVLFFAVAATRMLGFPEITAMLEEILALAGRVLFGAVIIAAGVALAAFLRRIIANRTAAQVAYWGTIVLFGAMGLKYMGIADSIINLAFGAIVVGGAVAAALAFGLGGREAAARALNKVEREQLH